MIIYHGSLEKVENPEIRLPNRTLDYGFGFYTTTSYKQAESWVKRRMEEKKVPKGFINIYEFDEKAMKTLNSLIFEVPTEEWVDFVMSNRTKRGFEHAYDVVYGPVANDKVYAAFALYEGGLKELEISFYGCKPYHSWERGANENMNGLIRQYIPKGTDFSGITDEFVAWVEEKLNNRPRKRLGYLTPNDKFNLLLTN